MSFITPILMVPSVYCACVVPQPIVTASTVRLISRFMWLPPSCLTGILYPNSYAEIVVKLLRVGIEFRIGEPVDDPAIFHHVVAVRNRRGEVKILLDQKDGEALLLE